MKCKVLEKSVFHDAQGLPAILEEGALVGDGTDYPVPKGFWTPKQGKHRGKKIPAFIPGPNLEALDDEAKKVKAEFGEDLLTLGDLPIQMDDPSAKPGVAKGV